MISDVKVETTDLISVSKADISILEKKIDSMNIMIDNINQYEHGDELVTSGDIIPHGSPTENCEDIIRNLFWHHSNMN